MPVHAAGQAGTYEVHGSTFESYVSTGRGGSTLCAWRLTVPPGLRGARHRPSHEEVLRVLGGRLTVELDGVTAEVGEGDVVHVPAGARLRVDGGPDGGSAWVTTTPGLQAETDDGAVLTPPWAQ